MPVTYGDVPCVARRKSLILNTTHGHANYPGLVAYWALPPQQFTRTMINDLLKKQVTHLIVNIGLHHTKLKAMVGPMELKHSAESCLRDGGARQVHQFF